MNRARVSIAVILVVAASVLLWWYSYGDSCYVQRRIAAIDGVELVSVYGCFDEGLYLTLALRDGGSLELGTGNRDAFNTGQGFWVEQAGGVRPVVAACGKLGNVLQRALTLPELLPGPHRGERIASFESLIGAYDEIAEALRRLPDCPGYRTMDHGNHKMLARVCKVDAEERVRLELAKEIFPCEPATASE